MGLIGDDVKQRLDILIKRGNKLYYALEYENADKEKKKVYEKRFKEMEIDASELPNFRLSYEIWYSESLLFVKKFIPDRMSDFVAFYKNEKRKEVTYLTYTISDALIGLTTTLGGEVRTSPIHASQKLLQQISILKSAAKLVDSVIYSMDFSMRSDLLDSELDAASELLKAGFLRASGAMCGVVIEKHLAQVCIQHGIALKKKSPTINDYNEKLKDASVIDLPTWRHIQLLGDLRNICCHDKSVEPSKEQANDLLAGTVKISKTVY